ncbi:GDP-L-fucose synthase [Aliifodinibius sp. S!AR15-10]|uniref:GDP-L-fucose synthase family protein n=1 Tax=Aliifodinibius sp. S!AR15-10 TaxID=2950437 RepID=UPI00285F4095|nr:GDP-L-fucose synthase [Aliifodinibius sp. S!AR15-10]MDR8390225.1 GDP-L-fucose synthase [Aliifodinibius sp. S!AR15-10]
MRDRTIYIAGHNGMVGSTVMETFRQSGYLNLVTRSSSELDLRKQADVFDFMTREQPEVVILAAARVGGILANDSYPYQFIYDNLAIQNNVIEAASRNDVEKLIFLGSSCIYPKHASQPLREEYLLTGSLEPTNQWYAIAKIAGIKLCEALRKQYNKRFMALMPTNLYGPRDNFDLETSHVVPALIRKFHEAKESGDQPVTLWGTGSPMREFLHVQDLAEAVLFAVENDLEESMYNIGTGMDLSIRELAQLIQSIVGHRGEIIWDTSKPDGTPRKLLDVSKIHDAGWHHSIELEKGLEDTYSWYLEHLNELKEVKI